MMSNTRFALVLLSLMALASPAAAADLSVDATLKLAADPQNGEAAFAICRGCHRDGGLGRPDGSYPRLAGQHATVIVKQLIDIQTGRRVNPKMLPFADSIAISQQDIADIAAYLQGLQSPPTNGRGPGRDLDRARARYASDCARCHGAVGEGNAAQFYPRVAGQHFAYLRRELDLIRSGERANSNAEMVAVIKSYTPDDLDAMSDLMSRLSAAR